MFVFSSLGEAILERFHNIIQAEIGHLPDSVLDDYRIRVRAMARTLIRECSPEGVAGSFPALFERELPELYPLAVLAGKHGWLLWAAQEGINPGPLSGQEEVVFQKYKEHYF